MISKRAVTATLYVFGLALIGWGVYCLLGADWFAVYSGLTLLALGGLQPLGQIFLWGIGWFPPADWEWPSDSAGPTKRKDQ